MDDLELLQAFVRDHSQEAFAQLVARHVNWVYSTCLRLMRDRHLAEDSTQAVFLVLARKAADLPPQVPLSGWLFRTCQYCCGNALRKEAIHRSHERKAAAMRTEPIGGEPETSWQEVSPVLDAGVAALREADRQAVLLRFYEGRSTRDVALALGLSEDAARKRLSRAMDKLRQWLGRRGIGISAMGLGALLAANTVQAAPAHLASIATTAALAAAGGAGASAASMALAKGAISVMAWAKVKAAVLTAAATLAAVLTVAMAATMGSRWYAPKTMADESQTETARAGLAIGGGAGGLAAVEAGANSASPAGGRILRLPANRHLGEWWVQQASEAEAAGDDRPWVERDAHWELLGSVTGDVRLPSGTRLALRLTPDAWADLSLLSGFVPDGLYKVSFMDAGAGARPAGDECIPQLAGVAGLAALDLRHTTISAQGLRQIAGLPSVRYVYLPAQTTDAGMAQLAQAKSLRGVYLLSDEPDMDTAAQRRPPKGQPAPDLLSQAGMASLARLPALEELALGGVQMDDAALAQIAGLPSLKYLRLWGGPFTDAGLACLRGNRSLRVLDLANLHPDGIGDEALAQLEQLPALESLAIAGGTFTDAGLAHVGKLSMLKFLRLSPTRAARPIGDEGIDHLADLKLLEELAIAAERASDRSLAAIARLPRLRRLHFAGGPELTSEGLLALRHCTALRELSLTGPRLTYSGLALLNTMTELRSLGISGVAPADGQLDLSGLHRLENLELSCPLDDADLRGIAALPQLTSLTVDATIPGPHGGISSAGMVHLVWLTSLQRLSLRAPRITDDALACLAGMKKLRHLHLEGNLTAHALRHLEPLTRLQSLSIGAPHAIGPEELRRLQAKLPNLGRVTIRRTNQAP